MTEPDMDEMVQATHDPIDPEPGEFDDADEGADDDGTPITSMFGSEENSWGDK